jgi:hypothetical protein
MGSTSSHASSGLAGAIAITLGLYVTAGLSLGAAFYWLMQPRVIDNAGVAAYRPPPRTVIEYAGAGIGPAAPAFAEAPLAAPQEPEPVASKVSETQPPPPKQEAGKGRAAASTRPRRSAQRRDPTRDFAYQPSFGFRPWF